MIAIGLMSGTSLDGVDAALVRIRPNRRSYTIDLLNFVTTPLEKNLMGALHALLPPNAGSVRELAQAAPRSRDGFRASSKACGVRYADRLRSLARTNALARGR